MKLLFFCPRWGSEDLSWESFCHKIKAAGYDGVEAGVPFEEDEQSQMLAVIRKQFKRFGVYSRSIYLHKNLIMKTLSLKLDDSVFEETEKVVSELKLARNRYINEALTLYNQFNKRRVLKKKLSKESRLVHQSSAEVLAEFEKLVDEI
jgi:sugar phosphate isomerase/epimerase